MIKELEEELKKIVQQEFKTNLDSARIFAYVENLEQENERMSKMINHSISINDYKKLKDKIDKVGKYLEENRKQYIYQDELGEDWYFENLDVFDELLEILKGEDNA